MSYGLGCAMLLGVIVVVVGLLICNYREGQKKQQPNNPYLR